MRISTKGRYALRLLSELSARREAGPVTLKQVAQCQAISLKYLEQIIPPLVRAGYVKSIRGSQGGYQLAQPPEEITVGMVLRLTEGSLAPVPCLEENSCQRAGQCATLELWKRLSAAVSGVVDHMTIAELTVPSQIEAMAEFPSFSEKAAE